MDRRQLLFGMTALALTDVKFDCLLNAQSIETGKYPQPCAARYIFGV